MAIERSCFETDRSSADAAQLRIRTDLPVQKMLTDTFQVSVKSSPRNHFCYNSLTIQI